MSNKLEGILESIDSVATRLNYPSREQFRDKKYERVGQLTLVKTRLTIRSGDEKHKIAFPGIVFADSVGHKVEYFIEGIREETACGSPMHVGDTHCLKDLEIDRTYTGCVNWETY